MTGMHRSGTTYLGEVLSRTPDSFVIHEPFNSMYGLAPIDYDYPALDFGFENELVKLIDAMESGRKLPFKRIGDHDGLGKRLLRSAIGGKTEVQWTRFRMLSRLGGSRRLIIKDPFLSLSTRTLAERKDSKIVHICRHPGAVWSSINKMGWFLNLTQTGGYGFAGEVGLIGNDEVEKVARLWKLINEHSYQSADIYKNILFITHEELCTNPFETMEKVCNFLDLTLNDAVLKYIEATSFGNSADKPDAKLHHFVRNSKELSNSWRNQVSIDEQKELKGISLELVQRIYGNW